MYTRERNSLPVEIFSRGICSYTELLSTAVIKCNWYYCRHYKGESCS